MKLALVIRLGAASIALAGIASTPPAGAASCRHQKAHNCFKLPATLDFSPVPEISTRIVGNEPNLRVPQDELLEQQPATKSYTGPMIGVVNHVGAPEVGYYWSIH
jgi:hypothetical protein